MPNFVGIRFDGDGKPIKKVIKDIRKDMDSLGKGKVKPSIFSAQEQAFLKREMTPILTKMKKEFKEINSAMAELLQDSKALGVSEAEQLKIQKALKDVYRERARLAKDIKVTEDMTGGAESSGAGGGTMAVLMKALKQIPVAGALAAGGYAVMKGMEANSLYKQGVGSRISLQGLGVSDDVMASPTTLANAGLTENEMLQQRLRSTSLLGKAGGSEKSVLQRAEFERARGLDAGTMGGIAGSLRSTMGGRGADQAQMKLQASIFASGIEEALGPYLDSATSLLSDINSNGLMQTNDLIRIFGEMSGKGTRTPEQIAASFRDVNSAMQGATGENSAFFQTAFAKAGIGGNTIGGANLALQGGLFGPSRAKLKEQGLSDALLDKLEADGHFKSPQEKAQAVLDQFKSMAGGAGIGDMNDPTQFTAVNAFANSIFGKKGFEGSQTLETLRGIAGGTKTQADYEALNKDTANRLAGVNASQAGQTGIVGDIRANTLTVLGKTTIEVENFLVRQDIKGIDVTKDAAEYAREMGIKIADAITSAPIPTDSLNRKHGIPGYAGASTGTSPGPTASQIESTMKKHGVPGLRPTIFRPTIKVELLGAAGMVGQNERTEYVTR